MMLEVSVFDDDVIDSRDIVAMADEYRKVAEADPEGELFPSLSATEVAEAKERLADLEGLLDEVRSATGEDPKDGVTLVRDSYFTQYAEEFAEDIGALPHDAGWPATFIDWERAARALQADYALVTWGGVHYWVR